MIIAVCSDKGAPGVTTLATLLALVWPGPAGVLEADPSGGDLTFRLRPSLAPEQGFLPPEPSVFTLAADARTGLAGAGLSRYTQSTTLGLRVIPGPVQAEMFTTVQPLWPLIATQAALWPEAVIADLGRLQPGHPAWPIAQAATAVLVLARPTVEGLYHLRERVHQLSPALGNDRQARNPVAVVMLAGAGNQKVAVRQAEDMLLAAGSPIPVAGWMADDPRAVTALGVGELTRSLGKSALLRSGRELATTLAGLWPELATSRPESALESAPESEPEMGRGSGSGRGSGRGPGPDGRIEFAERDVPAGQAHRLRSQR